MFPNNVQARSPLSGSGPGGNETGSEPHSATSGCGQAHNSPGPPDPAHSCLRARRLGGEGPSRQVGTWPKVGQVSAPLPPHWMGRQPHLPSWHLQGGAALGWWGPREGRGHLPGCARCHPQAAHRKGAPGALPCATPSPTPRVPSPAELCLWPGFRQLWLPGSLGPAGHVPTRLEARLCPQAGV